MNQDEKVEEQGIKVGDKILIGTPTGDNFGMDYREETHTVKEIEVNPHNHIVPHSITTCCGVFIPTSGSDGHWNDSIHYGYYRLNNQEGENE